VIILIDSAIFTAIPNCAFYFKRVELRKKSSGVLAQQRARKGNIPRSEAVSVLKDYFQWRNYLNFFVYFQQF